MAAHCRMEPGGVAAFGTAFYAASVRESLNGDWALTLEEWLPTLGLSTQQWEGMVLPWAASLFSGKFHQARGLSARAAFIFAAKALPPNPLDPILYYTLKPGLGEALDRMIDQFSTVSVLTGSKVVYVARTPNGGFRLYLANGTQIVVDHLVFASSGPATLKLLEGLPIAWRQRLALNGIEFHDAALALHTDPAYVPPNPALWSFRNCAIEGDSCEASMSLGPVLASLPTATAGKLWKSWVTHRTQLPAAVLYSVAFKHMLPLHANNSGAESAGVAAGTRLNLVCRRVYASLRFAGDRSSIGAWRGAWSARSHASDKPSKRKCCTR